jgi:transcription antitermination factor NusG
MTTGTESFKWYALQVRTRWESSTALLLGGKGYQTLLPTYKTTSEKKRRLGGGPKQANAPLFPGYVFCQFDVQNRLPILVTPGVIAAVSFGKLPIPVDEAEIGALQTIVSSGFGAEPWPYLELGQRIRIETDALKGLEGILINIKGNQRIVVSVSLLRRSVALEIDRSCVTPIVPARAAGFQPIATQPLLQGAFS